MHPKNILIALDDTKTTNQIMSYVASIIGGQEGFSVHLLHITALPLALLEFGGSEDPQREEKKETNLHEDRAQWELKAEKAAHSLFSQAISCLREVGIPDSAVHTHFVTASSESQEVVNGILEAARMYQCGTVVVGRKSFFHFRELFSTHVGDTLIRRGQGLAVWVVE